MTCLRIRLALAAGVAAVALASAPAQAQWIVFDPTNYAQNVLTAARELQQVNNEIQSLQNQATSLINQAKNLASLPYSSLTQLQQSINQTEQLLTQAQRIAYSVTAVNQAFTQTYPQAYSSATSSQQLLAGAELAGRTRSPGSKTRCASRPAWCRTSPPPAPRLPGSFLRAKGHPAPSRRRNLATSLWLSRPRSSPTSRR